MNRYLLILVLSVFFSCSKDGVKDPENIDAFELSKNPYFSSDCLIGEVAENITGGSCKDSNIDSSQVCELISIEERNTIENESKEWFKFYCTEKSDKIYYHDSDENETYFEFLDNGYFIAFSYRLLECPDDPLKKLMACTESERAYVNFYSPHLQKEFNLNVKENYRLDEFQITEKYPQIDLYTYNAPNSIKHFSFAPKVVKSSDTFFDQIEIHGKVFFDVYTFEDRPNPEAIQFFYNKEFGIVSFIDNNGTQWVLND